MRSERAWAGLAALLAAGALAASAGGFGNGGGAASFQALVDWQPALAARQPWRAWTSAFVHYSAFHLAANLAGAGLVAAFGAAARVPWRIVAAWALAWPLTQFALLARPELAHYGGLSGVLHAGVAAAALHLVVDARGLRRAIGLATLIGLAAKVAFEAPLGPTLRRPPGWDIAVAPFAHLAGLGAGCACAAVAEALRCRPGRRKRTLSIGADD